jgi:glutathione peroxidase
MRHLTRPLLLLLAIAATAFQCGFNRQSSRPADTNNARSAMSSFFDLKVNDLNGNPVDLHQYQGKTIVVLNVASECGFTPQYADWQRFYEANRNEVVVLGFPCNDFGGQEPGAPAQIATFCEKNYGVTFPLMEKVNIKGADKSPVYRWLTDPSQNGWNSEAPGWNFCKYLINEKGELTHFFGSSIKPDSQAFFDALSH